MNYPHRPLFFQKRGDGGKLKNPEGVKYNSTVQSHVRNTLTELKGENKCKMNYPHRPLFFQKRWDGGELKSPM